MKNLLYILISTVICYSCASIPQETIQLSKAVDSDIDQLHSEHKNLASLYFDKLESDVNSFINDVYIPFVIHNVLKKELDSYKNNDGGTIYDAINNAGTSDDKESVGLALDEMSEFQEAANLVITNKRKELLTPIQTQRKLVIESIDNSFDNMYRASTSITHYLYSLGKLKESQEVALSRVGLLNADQYIRKDLLQTSSIIEKAIDAGNQIDVKSDNAFHEINKVSEEIKKLSNKIK